MNEQRAVERMLDRTGPLTPKEHDGPHTVEQKLNMCIICWRICDSEGNEITLDELYKIKGWTKDKAEDPV